MTLDAVRKQKPVKLLPLVCIGVIRVQNLWCSVDDKGSCVIPGTFCDKCKKPSHLFKLLPNLSDRCACPCGRAYSIKPDPSILDQTTKDSTMQFNTDEDETATVTPDTSAVQTKKQKAKAKKQKVSAMLDDKPAPKKSKKAAEVNTVLDEEDAPAPKAKKPKAKKVKIEIDPSSKLVLAEGITFKEGSISQVVGSVFRKPKTREAGIAAAIAKYEAATPIKERSPSYVKRPEAYVNWYVNALVDSSKLIEA